MSNFEDYIAKLDEIKAISNENVQSPNQPVDVFLQESENLGHWSKDDAAQLNVVGITNEMLDDLPKRTGACREAQSIWNKDFRSQKEAQKQWKLLAPPAYELRDDLLKTMKYAYRNEPDLLSRVAAITIGDGHADMIQDLNDIAVLGKENPDALTAIGFDVTQLNSIALKADEMAVLLAQVNGDKAELNESKVIRDKAYCYLKELVDEIREAGKYVFRNNKARYKGYTSSFWKHKNRRKTKASKDTAPAEQE